MSKILMVCILVSFSYGCAQASVHSVNGKEGWVFVTKSIVSVAGKLKRNGIYHCADTDKGPVCTRAKIKN